MVQEFHVVRCFSCRTFQVQQVKKSKKWSCKMCAEKQSLIKDYGRGTGAECRRHVQKLNSLRGDLLEVEYQQAWTQWETQEECEAEVGPGDETESWENKVKGQTQVESRWSKYVEQKENEPGCDEDELEEEEPQQHHQHSISRKRKKSFTSGAVCRRYTVEGKEDTDTDQWGATGLPSRPRWHDDTFKPSPQVPRSSAGFPRTRTSLRKDALFDSPATSLGSKHISAFNSTCSRFTETDKQSSAELCTKHQPSVPLSSVSAPSFSFKHPNETKQAKDSKWARFLPSVCTEEDGDAQRAVVDYWPLTRSSEMPLATVLCENTGCTSSEGSKGALWEMGRGVEKVTDLEKLRHCVNGNICQQPNSPTITSKPSGSQKPVCAQPLPIKRPCPTFSISTLFHTDEDFDDKY